MYTFLIAALIFFGIGCCIGAAYAFIRYGIPIFIKGTVGIVQGGVEGWQKGVREVEEKYGRK